MSDKPRLSQEEYRLLIENAPMLVWRAGLDARCDWFNDTWLAFTGRTLAQELGDGWADGVHPEDFQQCLDTFVSHFERRLPFEMEYRLRRHDGMYRYILDRGTPFSDAAGRFAGFIGSCVDVHDRRQLAAELEEQLRLAGDAVSEARGAQARAEARLHTEVPRR